MAEKFKFAKDAKEFEAMFGDGFVDIDALARNSGFRSTGSLKVDGLLRGGLPKGTMAEFWGPPQSGKSTLATASIGHVLRGGGRACYVDLERGLDLYGEADYVEAALDQTDEDRALAKEAKKSWLRKNGVDCRDPNFRIYDPLSGEELFRFLGNIITLNYFDVVVVDSVAAILTEKQLEGDTGESHFGAVAKLLSAEMPRLLRLYRNNQNTNVIFINQARDKIGFMQQGQKSTGGHALEHYVGTKIRFRRINRKEESSGDMTTTSRVNIDKSRYASAREITMQISGERGVDVLGELLEFGEQQGYVHGGTWRHFFEHPITPDAFREGHKAKKIDQIPGFLGKANGEDASKLWMETHGWFTKLYDEAVRVGFAD